VAVRTAAVIGAGGFIGRHLVATLRSGGIHVVTSDRADQPYRPGRLDAADVVFYLASSITPALAEAHPQRAAADQDHLGGLLRHLTECERPSTVVLSGSAGTVYDPDAPQPWAEDAPTRPTTRYGAAKLAMEWLLREHRGPAIVLRLSNVYGPGQRVDKSQGVLGFWLRAAATGEPLNLIGDPQTTRDYVYVDDVVNCLLLAGRYAPPLASAEPLVVNVGSGVSTSLAELLSTVERVVGTPLPVRALPGRAIDRRDVRLDVGRAQRWLSWRAETSLVDGISAAWRELRDQPA
jgi:UDP-glucose 4-epimerase